MSGIVLVSSLLLVARWSEVYEDDSFINAKVEIIGETLGHVKNPSCFNSHQLSRHDVSIMCTVSWCYLLIMVIPLSRAAPRV